MVIEVLTFFVSLFNTKYMCVTYTKKLDVCLTVSQFSTPVYKYADVWTMAQITCVNIYHLERKYLRD